MLMLALTVVPGAPTSYQEGPCKAVHYGQEAYDYRRNVTSMREVLTNRLTCPGRHCIRGLVPRRDVVDYIAVRNADQWRIKQNWRALVTFRRPNGTYTTPVWLQPIDYQHISHVTSRACRVEASEKLARSQGWSMYQGWGLTRAYILRWER